MTGRHVNLTDERIEAIAHVYSMPRRRLERLVDEQWRRVNYRLPPHLEAKLTPERWDQLLAKIERWLT